MNTYPLCLVRLREARCVVVGGGEVAARKVAALLDAGASVTVIAPSLCEELQSSARDADVEVLMRPFRPGDLNGAFLAIAATDDATVNAQVSREARTRTMLVNVVDDPEQCNFIAPSVLRRGPLTLAISTSGRCPALSRHIRERLEHEFGAPYGDYVRLLGELREDVVDALPLIQRRAFWKDVFESNLYSLLASGREKDAHRLAESILERHEGRER